MLTIAHGTYAGYSQEQRSGLPHCDACRAANREYMKRYRRPGTAAHAKNAGYNEARNEAVRNLIASHRGEYEALLSAEYEALKAKTRRTA